MKTLYVLLCEGEKYYIGVTDRDINERLVEHWKNIGSSFTKKYKPIKTVEVIDNVDTFDEDKYVKMYMSKYGIENVRGGSYSELKLPDYKIKSLNDEISTGKSLCFKCRREGHYVKDCPMNYEISTGEPLCFKCKQEGHYVKDCPMNVMCSKCLRYGHITSKCYVKKTFCNICKRYGHSDIECYATTDADGSCICNRCKRSGHMISKCYAKTDINGNKIFDGTGPSEKSHSTSVPQDECIIL